MNSGWAALACIASMIAGFIGGVCGVGDMYNGRIKSGLVQVSGGAVYRTTRIEGGAP